MRGWGASDDEETDDLLMERYAGGNVQAFDELYARWERPLFGFLLRFLADREAAVDAFQEVWLRVVESRSVYRGRGRFRSWLFTIARRICVDRALTGRRAEARESRGAAAPGASEWDAPPDEELARSEELTDFSPRYHPGNGRPSSSANTTGSRTARSRG